MGPKERNVGLTYCALSRAKSLAGLAFDGTRENPMPSYDRFTRYYNYEDFKAVRKEEKRLDELAKQTMEAYQMETIMEEMDLDQVSENMDLCQENETSELVEMDLDQENEMPTAVEMEYDN